MRFIAAALMLAPGLSWARPATRGLAQEDARSRASHVRDVGYTLAISVDGERSDFSGRADLRFSLDSAVEGLTVDFEGGKVSALEINGQRVSSQAYNGLFVALPAASLRAGANRVSVEYTHPYMTTGVGLYRFVDPEDKRVYLWSQFEPYDANKLFPCFDQPDLKAAYSLTVEAPSDWKVVSAVPETKTIDHGGKRTWVFGETPRLSTYLLSLHAGQYHVWSSSAGATPLRLFSRESMAKYVDADWWFHITRQGLAFYGEYFSISYPFGKYDQLIVPDFNAGAMENAGAVTFSERNVHRSRPTDLELEATASDILHEMAHMWFGDYVTMRWWNGLWLNESFATYMAARALGGATRFKESWRSFFADDKTPAYDADWRRTTHPIEGEVPDTQHAWANFDSITYGKGASVMRQLEFLIGEDVFRDGVRRYMTEHAYGNTEEGDFFGAMEKASGADLGAWRREWLDAAGVDTVRPEVACDKSVISSLALAQSASREQPTLRRHRTEVALYRSGKTGAWDSVGTARVTYSGARTEVPDLVGKPCPDLVFSNAGDHDYAKLDFDARSISVVRAGVMGMVDPHHRLMLWLALWGMVRDGRFSAADYAGLVVRDAGREADIKIVGAIVETVVGRHETSPALLNYLPKPDPRVEAAFWDNLRGAAQGSDLQKIWLDAYVEVASSREGEKNLRAFLAGTAGIAGLELDEDRRWSVVEALNALGVKDGDALLAAESQRDSSDRGANAAIAARAARPHLKTKREWLAKIVDPRTKLSYEELRSAMERFNSHGQARLIRPLFPRILESLETLSKEKDDDFLGTFGFHMAPFLCDDASAAALDKRLDSLPGLNPNLARPLRDSAEDWRRCVRARGLLTPG